MRKYSRLGDFFSMKNEKSITLSMREIEEIIDDALPESAYKYVAWWSNSNTKAHPHSRAWTEYGYKTVDVNNTILKKIIIFEKQ